MAPDHDSDRPYPPADDPTAHQVPPEPGVWPPASSAPPPSSALGALPPGAAPPPTYSVLPTTSPAPGEPDAGHPATRAALPFVWLLSLVLAFTAGLLVESALFDTSARGASIAAVPSPIPTAAPSTSSTPTQTSRPTGTAEPSESPAEPSESPAAPSESPAAQTPGDSAAPTGSSAPPGPTPTATPGGPPQTQPPSAPADFGVFWEALKTVQDHYVDRAALDDPNLTYGAIRGMVDALKDTGHSVFLTPEDLQAEEQSLQGVLVGIGVFLDTDGAEPIFSSVISGGPADRAGMRPGDRLIMVDDKDVGSLEAQDIVKLVRGPEGTTVRITVIHRGETEPVTVSIVREKITIPPVTSAIVQGTDILDLRVIQFSTGAADEFHKKLQEGINAGARRIVLDLRNDPGGYVNEAVAIASEFLAQGDVYISQNAQGERTPAKVVDGGLAHDLKLVVLVDKATASSAEIVAGALQDAQRGPVIGVTTFGTGTLLNVFTLSDGSAVRLGVEQWLTPKARQIWRKGIEPDVTVELPTDGVALEPDEVATQTLDQLRTGTDPQFAKGLELLQAP